MLSDHLDALGVHSRPLRAAVVLLGQGWQEFDSLVRTVAVPRRTVEELLDACGSDLQRDGTRVRLTPGAYPDQAPPRTISADLPTLLADLHANAPRPVRALDHVPATVDTMLRRATWLDETYHLPGARLVCVGDHDLTALAACALRPDLTATVVDLDEDLLAYVDKTAIRLGLSIRCLHADFRFGLPPSVTGSADLVFTDPPYTPEGMRLFLARGIEALRDPAEGRLLVAYGYSPRNPALGLAVQQEVQKLGVVFEAILPSFNRYHGAQAVGSASDLYVCQPTAKSRKIAEATARGKTGIYTHGPQSVEASGPDPDALAALLRIAGCPSVQAPGWSTAIQATGPVAYDLSADPGPWLARTLIGAPSVRVAALVPNNHPDIADQQGQQALSALLKAKYALTFHRSTPDGKHAVVAAEPVQAVGLPAALLRYAHGKVGNVWRESLIRASDGTLTKRTAREQVAAQATRPEDLDQRLVDLPRHRVVELLGSMVDK